MLFEILVPVLTMLSLTLCWIVWRPQFSIKLLLIGTAIIACGMALLVASTHVVNTQRVLLATGAFAAIGAGLFTPFRRMRFGAILGVAIPYGVILMAVLMGIRV